MLDNKNFFVAIALSMGILLLWQVYVLGPQEAERQAQAEREAAQQTNTQANTQAVGGTAGNSTVGEAPSVGGGTIQQPSGGAVAVPGALASVEQVLSNGKRVEIDSPSISGSINLVGGRIDDVLLKNYRVTNDDDSDLIRLFHPVGTSNAYYAETGFVTAAGGPALPTATTEWQLESGNVLAPGSDIVLGWENGSGLTFKRTFSVDENYLFTIKDSVTNASGADAQLFPYGFVSRRGEPETTGIYILHEGPIGVFGEEGLVEISYGSLEDDREIKQADANKGWLGITDKYWAATLVPPEGNFKGRFKFSDGSGAKAYQADFLSDALNVGAGSSVETTTRLFAGAKETTLVDGYQNNQNIDRFELLIDWGWFYFLTKPMFHGLHYFYELLGNFGLAILALTVVVKAIFFWFANKSYVSMSRMKLVQPKMKEIQERFKEDRARQQQELMKLYKEEKINPLAGCWPVLIQIPVFFALYKVLFVTIEMRHAPFFGWIQDLAAQDPTTVFNLFGLLPYSMPEWFPVLGVWPLIMGVTMFIQMKLNPAPPDPTQQLIFNWMPVVFTFMLASFPAGLVIYWAWNNTLSIAQQYVIMTRQGVKVDILGNILDTFRKEKKSSQIVKED